jgi:hypothetical protein
MDSRPDKNMIRILNGLGSTPRSIPSFDPLTASAVGLNLAPALQRNLALETAGWRGLTRRMMAR